MESLRETPRYLKVQEAAAYLRVSADFLNKDRLTKLHGIPFARIGRRVLYDRLALDVWLSSRAENCSA